METLIAPMDYLYYMLVSISMLVYLGLPVFWLTRHFIFINYKGKRLEKEMITYLIIVFTDAAIFAILSPYVNLKNELPEYAALVGAALIAAWIIIESSALRLLMSAVKNAKKSRQLITSGPYAMVRHPIYLAHVLFNLGAYLVTGAWIPLFVLAEWLVLIKPLMDMEEEELALRFEEQYLKYRKKVPQIVPKIK